MYVYPLPYTAVGVAFGEDCVLNPDILKFFTGSEDDSEEEEEEEGGDEVAGKMALVRVQWL